ncbi:MAG TPA: OmpA family protein [Nevskiaceae bacterium]|nr:OmpA family protein [Nevskiaceae bacterium]
MKRLLLAAIAFAAVPAFADDAEGCKDHPLFNRMPGYELQSCDSKEFDAREFPSGGKLDNGSPVQKETVEGAQTTLQYCKPPDDKHASGLQIARNFENAVKAAGGTVIAEFGGEHDPDTSLNDDTYGWTDHAAALKLAKSGKEIHALVVPYNEGTCYALYIGEKQAMQQAVKVNELVDKINKDGFIALYINFDTAKATIKPDSNKQLDDVASALKSAPELKLEVAGHTDNVGDGDANQKLSEARAKSVMDALVNRGIAASRLTAKGYGASKPVADNRGEDGRAKNRRVELVKQ